MSEPNVVLTLRRKRDEIVAVIERMERDIKSARSDLAHVNATLHLFEVGDAPRQFPVYMDVSRLFRPRELTELCREALSKAQAPMTTRELATYVVAVKGFDEADKALRSAIAHRIVNALMRRAKRGAGIVTTGRRAGVREWEVEGRDRSPAPILYRAGKSAGS